MGYGIYGTQCPNGDAAQRGNQQSGTTTVMCDGGQDPDQWVPQGDAPTYGDVDDLTARQYIDAVRAGFDTHSQAADAMDAHRSTASRNLGPLAKDDDAPIRRLPDGNGVRYEYDPSLVDDGDQDQGGNTTSSTQANGQGGNTNSGAQTNGSTPFPKPRSAYPADTPDYRHNYDHEEKVPDGVAEYHPSGDELMDLRMLADNPGAFTGAPVMALEGPTGAGKTHSPKYVADQKDMAYYEVAMSESADPADLKGYRDLRPEGSVWIDGPVVKALLSSQERPTMLVFDEANRAIPEVFSVLMEVLDDRCQLTLESRGGEKVQGDPDNLTVVATMNPDDGEHEVHRLGRAQERRFKYQHWVDYLGRENPTREADVLVERVGVTQEWADKAVEAANTVRDLADTEHASGFGAQDQGQDDDDDSGYDSKLVSRGTPTGSLIDLARKAKLHADAGHPQHNARAIKTTLKVCQTDDGRQVATEVFKDKLGNTDPSNGGGA